MEGQWPSTGFLGGGATAELACWRPIVRLPSGPRLCYNCVRGDVAKWQTRKS